MWNSQGMINAESTLKEHLKLLIFFFLIAELIPKFINKHPLNRKVYKGESIRSLVSGS